MQIRVGRTAIETVQGDITAQATDAIVNAANSSLMGGGGVDGAIHRAGGPAILEACRQIAARLPGNRLPAGQAVITAAGRLPAGRVIHTVGPVWEGGGSNEDDTLASAYTSCLHIAKDEGLRAIAFPSISTGAYGFPTERAATIALGAIHEFVLASPGAFDVVRMVLFSAGDLSIYEGALRKLGTDNA